MLVGTGREAKRVDETPKKGDARRAPEAYKAEVGAAVRTARLAGGFTQEKLALAIGVDISTISGIERGANVPSLPVLEAIASVLIISIDELIGRASRAAALTEATTPTPSSDSTWFPDAMDRINQRLSPAQADFERTLDRAPAGDRQLTQARADLKAINDDLLKVVRYQRNYEARVLLAFETLVENSDLPLDLIQIVRDVLVPPTSP